MAVSISTQNRVDVSNLYVALFGRAPDGEGLGYWSNSIVQGSTLVAVADTMFATPAARAYYPAYQTNEEIVASFYKNVLGRTADTEGLAHWTNELNKAGATIGSVVTEMLAVVTNYTGTNADGIASAELFAAKAGVALAYGLANASVAVASTALAGFASVTTASDAATVAAAVAAANALLNPVATGKIFPLTTLADNLTGTALNDTFLARTTLNVNTLQDGDKIDGGEGTDSLIADFANTGLAITPVLTNVETVVIRAQGINTDATNGNNVSSGVFASTVQIDAQRSLAVSNLNQVTADTGVTLWESNNSRSDVIIEDVRIGNKQITSEVTIAMVETDPGNVDFGVYFDQQSLRNSSSSSSSLNIKIMDIKAAGLTPLTPLLNSPYDGFTFQLGGVTKTIKSAEIDAATTYAALFDAITKAVAAAKLTDASLAGLTVTKSGTFLATDADTQIARTGETIVLTNTGSSKLEAIATNGYTTATGVVPTNSNLYTIIDSASNNASSLVTSKIILDDVGRGSTGGDLVVGGLSVGATSTSRGVERFDITVNDNSKLQTINSTNNALREVTIVNGTTSNTVVNAYVANGGNLTVNGNVNMTSVIAVGTVGAVGATTGANLGSDKILAGVNNTNTINGYAADHHGAFGFTDVRLIDGSNMTGNLAFTAQVTNDSIAKYVTAVDTAARPTDDKAVEGAITSNLNFNIKGANFIYAGGAGADVISVTVDGGVTASRSNLAAGLSDFTFSLVGGAGNDALTLNLADTTGLTGGAQNWYNNQDLNNNITVDGGAGNDTIRTPGAGDVNIFGGTGDDTIFTDNTGSQAGVSLNAKPNAAGTTVLPVITTSNGQWVFNTRDQATVLGVAPVATAYGASARNLNDLRSDINNQHNFFNSTVTVNFKGITATYVVAGTGYKTTDLEINQAIKYIINNGQGNVVGADPTANATNSAVLSKLLVAEDGPANTLVVRSLIDGSMAAGDLTVTLALSTAALSAADIVAAGAAYGITTATVSPTAASVGDVMVSHLGFFNRFGDYSSALGTDGLVNLTGAPSVTSSDNIVRPGTDNDVIVLGTTVSALGVAASSNETVVFDYGFGNDTIVNFAVAGNGVDYLDFTAMKGTTLAGITTDKSITINPAALTAATATVTEKAAIEALFNVANNATAMQDHVYVSVSTAGVGSVWTVVDPIGFGPGNTTATLQGTINLGSAAAWLGATGLATTSFVNVNSTAFNYALQNGATGVTAVTPAPVTPITYAVAATAASFNEGTSATFTVTTTGVANGTTVAYTLAGINQGAADFTAPVPLTVTINNNTGTITVPLIADLTTEAAAETLVVTLTPDTTKTATATIADTSQTTPVAGTPVSVAVSATATPNPYIATVAVETFNIAVGTYTYTIDKFANGDFLKFFAGASLNVVPDANDTDGIQSVTGANADGSQTVTITLTGLTAAQDAGVFNLPSFATQFGVGSLA